MLMQMTLKQYIRKFPSEMKVFGVFINLNYAVAIVCKSHYSNRRYYFVQWVPGLYWGIKRPKPGADHPPLSSAGL